MRHTFASLGAASLVLALCTGEVLAQGLKPYVVMILDTSGSMDAATGAGPPTCGGIDNRLNHARCAINQIANSYGDMVFALGRFRETPGGTYTTSCDADGDIRGAEGDQCTSTGVACNLCSCNERTSDCLADPDCTAELRGDARGEMLTGLVEGNNHEAATWTDFTCNTCGMTLTSNPEIWGAGSWTPLTGALLSARRYWQGLQASDVPPSTIWPSTSPGFDPITNDPLSSRFLPSGEQCRPYVTILLTDGAESCGGEPSTAAASLLATPKNGRTYRIETKPIGFGITPGVNGQADIEAIAHAGGATDVANAYEGYYANNQSELSLAIGKILADTIRSESCNDDDDDCDTEVDEDFPSLGGACHNGLGRCRGTGVFVCTGDHTDTVCSITMPGGSPSAEICNDLDDNCNGLIDEGLMCGGCTDEICDNMDNDCDTRVDEGLVRQCGTDLGECTAGTETCVLGTWGACTGTGPVDEICDGFDNDCDGICDGFSRPCTELAPPGNPNRGRCHSGIQVCPALCTGSGNSFGDCLDEVVPVAEVCNCADDDCDGINDDGTGGANCDNTCGVGTTVCDQTTCALRCESAVVSGPELVCNGLDDNCDGRIDEDYVSVACTDGGTICNGHTECVSGNVICVGSPIGPPQCNCDDNDCDGNFDETGSCPGGSTCTSCQCAYPCDNSEFPCTAGTTCIDGFCLIDNCATATCPPDGNGNATVCIPNPAPATTHRCEPACDHLPTPCPTGSVCLPSTGQCVFDDCRTFPNRCADDELCQVEDNRGACVRDLCFETNCPPGQYCLGGECLASCGDIRCLDGERCRMGRCEPDPCGGPCPDGLVCRDTTRTCVENPCADRQCPGEACDPQTGECIIDTCNGTTCPGDDICVRGTCYDPSMFQPATKPPERVTVGGGGCSAGGGAGAGWLLALLALLGFGARRRRQRGGDL